VKKFGCLSIVLGWLVASTVAFAGGTGVFVNGQHLSPSELQSLQYQVGGYVPRGRYLADGRTGCWFNIDTGASGCVRRGGGSPADRWVSPDELSHGGLRGVRPGPLTTYDFVR